MKGIIEACQLPANEKVYLKKDWAGYRIVHPIKDPITNKINWFNLLFGGKRFAVTSGVALLLLLFLGLAYQHDIEAYKHVVENPCDYCAEMTYINYTYEYPTLNVTKFDEFVVKE